MHRGAVTSCLSRAQLYERAVRYYADGMKGKTERMVSGSDDFSLHLWQNLGNDPAVFSPATASALGGRGAVHVQ